MCQNVSSQLRITMLDVQTGLAKKGVTANDIQMLCFVVDIQIRVASSETVVEN